MPDLIDAPQREGFSDLDAFWDKVDAIESALEDFSAIACNFVGEQVDTALDQVRAFEPSVSVVGQIKAGKSTLLNALIGQPGLLPSDVNPWTSVITAVHLNSRGRMPGAGAIFRFFDRHEWDRLVETGGRLGQMAERAGFSSEADEVRRQVTEMRSATEARLGAQFEALLGRSHTFPEVTKDILDRYICYGDPAELADGGTEGVYADLTKSADLYLDVPGLPRGLCLRDTPGVNDTFMMREQITLNAISDSRVCVVVLSAHQALSTMDLALLRIICAIDAREVVIFVNRIDELADCRADCDRIGRSIRQTLARMGIGDTVEILFGSGYWANFAQGGMAALSDRSRAALAAMFDGTDTDDPDELRARALAASGVPDLRRAISKRVVGGPGAALLADVQANIDSFVEMTELVDSAAQHGAVTGSVPMTPEELAQDLSGLRTQTLAAFDAEAAELRARLRERLERAQETFVASALEALAAHVATLGEAGAWHHDPSNLRMMMRTAYSTSCARLRRAGETACGAFADGVQDLLQTRFGIFRESGTDFPEQPQHKPPTVLARTLTLDLQAPWWRKFWRFGLAGTVEKRYRAMIVAETTPLIDDLMTGCFDPAVAQTREVVETFALRQDRFCAAILEALEARTGDGADNQWRISA